MNAPVEWIPGVSVLVFGIAVAAFLLFRTKKGVDSHAEGVEDQQRSFDALIARLRETDVDPHLTDIEKRDEIARLEIAAAQILRDMENAPVSAAAIDVPVQSAKPLRAMMWLTGSVVVAAVMYLVLLQSIAPRTESAPVTGGATTQAQMSTDPRIASLQQSVRANPDDFDARIELARAAIEQRDMLQVFEQTEYILRKQPNEPRALTYQALARLSMGEPERARDMLQAALQQDPKYLDAWLHMSVVQLEMGNTKGALDALDVAKRYHPDRAAAIDLLRSEVQARANGGTTMPQEAASSDFAGVLELDASAAAKVKSGAVVFVTVRGAGVTAGPPLAAKRLAAESFPLAFSLSAADSMRGDALPKNARIEARIDLDGNPLTNEGAPAAVLDNVASGQTKLKLVLR